MTPRARPYLVMKIASITLCVCAWPVPARPIHIAALLILIVFVAVFVILGEAISPGWPGRLIGIVLATFLVSIFIGEYLHVLCDPM